MLDELRELYDYNRWANHRILGAASALSREELERDLASSFPSVLATLVHVLAAEWVWLSRWRGHSPSALPDWDLSSLDALRAKWDEVERDQRSFLADLDEETLMRRLPYRNTRGEPFEQPLWQLMRHVVNHSSYHRGQVVTLLRQLGSRAVATDLVLYYREREGERAAPPPS